MDLSFSETRSNVHVFDSNENWISEQYSYKTDSFEKRDSSEQKNLSQLGEDELTQKRLSARATYLKNYFRQKTNALMGSFIWILVASLFFWDPLDALPTREKVRNKSGLYVGHLR